MRMLIPGWVGTCWKPRTPSRSFALCWELRSESVMTLTESYTRPLQSDSLFKYARYPSRCRKSASTPRLCTLLRYRNSRVPMNQRAAKTEATNRNTAECATLSASRRRPDNVGELLRSSPQFAELESGIADQKSLAGGSIQPKNGN